MICDSKLIPSDCINYYSLKKNCYLSQVECNRCIKNMNGGITILIASLMCLILQIATVFSLKAYIQGKNYCKSIRFCLFSSGIYSIAFIIWNQLSDFDPTVYSPSFGLTIAFTVIFFQVFLSFHFFTFRKYVVEYYFTESNRSSEKLSIVGSMQRDQ